MLSEVVYESYTGLFLNDATWIEMCIFRPVHTEPPFNPWDVLNARIHLWFALGSLEML